MKLKDFLTNNRETFQLIYGIILIIIIPFLIAFNTVFIINKYNKNLDVALQRESLTVGRTIYALIKDDLTNAEILQKKLESLLNKNLDFKNLTVLIPEDEAFKIIASTEKNDVGKSMNSQYYTLAWSQPDNDGLATDSLLLTSSMENQKLTKDSQNERFWLVTMPMTDASGKKQALLSMRLSSKIVDDLTNYNRNASLFLLILTILIVVLFLSAAVRLWDYAILYKKIKEVDQMKDEFISMASHELRTPITAIRGYISMVLEGSYGEINNELQESMKIVQGSSDRLALLIEDLLNVSRIEQGRIKLDNAPTDVDPIIRDIISELRIQADKKTLKLRYKKDSKLPQINIDTDRLKQVLINLIGNAIKYTEKGSVEIIAEEKIKGKMLEIKVKDTGMGISAKDREKLFEKFYRVRNLKTQNITGTGLGLWITKQIVELMNGKISVDSIENVGTQVTLQFPIVK